jgi:hypothetical protein
MPKEITAEEIDDSLLERTIATFVKRSGDKIKYKLRTSRLLYTVCFTDEVKANQFRDRIERANIPIETI